MKWLKRALIISSIAVLTLAYGWHQSYNALAATDTAQKLREELRGPMPFSGMTAQAPTIDKPDWYYDVVFTYTVGKNGATSSDLAQFSALANETLNDARGWARLGIRFEQVSSGGMFNLVLAQGSLLPSYSSGCSVEWSCRVGSSVIINDTRWSSASESWNAQSGSLRDYRHMVINHEVGHWLGHDHLSCGGAGQLAPLMQQQSIDLQGCRFNPWPLDAELWTSRL
jgi:hypothetical protein